MKTLLLRPDTDPQATQTAADILRRGGLVGIPTETVYGLGANALDGEAVRHIFEAKGRPQDNPLIIHVPDASWLERYCHDVPPQAYLLAERFWPGPLTMILPCRDIVPAQTTAGLPTVGVRCPNHPATLRIIAAAGVLRDPTTVNIRDFKSETSPFAYRTSGASASAFSASGYCKETLVTALIPSFLSASVPSVPLVSTILALTTCPRMGSGAGDTPHSNT